MSENKPTYLAVNGEVIEQLVPTVVTYNKDEAVEAAKIQRETMKEKTND